MKSPFPKYVYSRNAAVYKLLANPVRLEILNILRNKETSVGELTRILRLRKANVSQHLALLRHTRLVRMRRNGLNVYYTITDPRIVEPCRIIHQLLKRKSFA